MKTIKTVLLIGVFAMITAFSLVSDKGYRVGDFAIDFNLKNVDGKMISMSSYTNAKGFVVIFTCNMCPYSVAYEDRIIALDKKYKSKGYPVIAINPNDPEASKGDGFEDMKIRAKEKGFTFPYLFDKGQKVYPKYGATRTPHVFILNKEGDKFRVEYIGAIDNNSHNPASVTKKYAEDAIDALIEGKKPSKRTSKAIGCTIKTVY